ncbi:hypothetical protein V7024_19855 [Bacillus sp. JJ864]|uniref:hypothetical protein n=1 Tax=Bacillus sp. JJ864 TaxID=3122975 RepID=UPI000BEE31D7|nr:hypothetical protein CON64_12360 [Bacillus pseudomycoides]
MKCFRDQLREWKKQQQKKRPKRKEEQLSVRDIEELMGMYRPRYVRNRGGAFRQK